MSGHFWLLNLVLETRTVLRGFYEIPDLGNSRNSCLFSPADAVGEIGVPRGLVDDEFQHPQHQRWGKRHREHHRRVPSKILPLEFKYGEAPGREHLTRGEEAGTPPLSCQ